MDDGDSVFGCYKELIRLRKKYPVFTEGRFQMLLAEDRNLFAYTREDGETRLLVVCNFYGQTVECPLGETMGTMELLLGNYKETERMEVLRPYEARMYLGKM